MQALPLVFATLIALALAPALLRALAQGGHVRPNWRGRELPLPLGLLPVAAGLIALAPVAVLVRAGGYWSTVRVPHALIVYAVGVALLGLVDDVFGGPARGWRGHAAALREGRISTGALKAGGSLGLALYTVNRIDVSTGRWLLASAVLVLSTNAFNLLDLRPGRASKAFALLGASLTLGAWRLEPLWLVGLFAGPALVAGAYDLRERAMLGDTGSNLLGGLAGWWLVLALSTAGQLVALGILVLVTVYGELRSISALIERVPGLRELDSWGRPSSQ